jgi:hypothetical protein
MHQIRKDMMAVGLYTCVCREQPLFLTLNCNSDAQTSMTRKVEQVLVSEWWWNHYPCQPWGCTPGGEVGDRGGRKTCIR